ncbi:2-oxo acid dehydrogenase subunit E2 [Streptomyces sp. NPDC059544]|uniref:2-oxo acid dehydrogenase subunit E2 n=1 Tax=Streptomyces sp. NPDC059544 TaxID=3346861 RepID=UPI0036CB7A19
MRQAIAALMTRANRDIPHYYLSTNVDMAAAMELAARAQPAQPGRRTAASRSPAAQGGRLCGPRGARTQRPLGRRRIRTG